MAKIPQTHTISSDSIPAERIEVVFSSPSSPRQLAQEQIKNNAAQLESWLSEHFSPVENKAALLFSFAVDELKAIYLLTSNDGNKRVMQDEIFNSMGFILDLVRHNIILAEENFGKDINMTNLMNLIGEGRFDEFTRAVETLGDIAETRAGGDKLEQIRQQCESWINDLARPLKLAYDLSLEDTISLREALNEVLPALLKLRSALIRRTGFPPMEPEAHAEREPLSSPDMIEAGKNSEEALVLAIEVVKNLGNHPLFTEQEIGKPSFDGIISALEGCLRFVEENKLPEAFESITDPNNRGSWASMTIDGRNIGGDDGVALLS